VVTCTTDEPPLLVTQVGSVGRIQLNRPKALNSLTLEMVQRMADALDAFEASSQIASVLVTGAGGRALAAGGDIRALFESGKAGTPLAEDFWRNEYRLNARISRFTKPYIAVMDGITMGGGVGIAVHSRFRIVTERTRFAMPETGIGYFPDVGASWFLPRSPRKLGTYLGLTGSQIGAGDVLAAHLADFFVPSDSIEALATKLAEAPQDASWNHIAWICRQLAEPNPSPAIFGRHSNEIARCFQFDTIEQILDALSADATEFALQTGKVLLSKSPTSLKLTLRLLQLGRAASRLEECLEREFVGSLNILAGADFYEGVRAVLIDRDSVAQWKPSRLDEVTDESVDMYLTAPPALVPVFAR